MMAAASDEQLAQRLRRGDRAALSALIERHYDPLLGYLYRLLDGQRETARDLTQEAFLRLLRGIQHYDPSRPFKPWLYAIATHLARDHAASADSRHVYAWDAALDPEADAPGYEAVISADESAAAVRAALRTLPVLQREILILFYYQSLSQGEIAAALGIPVGTVKSRLHGAVRMLRARLALDDHDLAERIT